MSYTPETNSRSYLACLMPHVTALAREAGNAIMEIYGVEGLFVDYKQDKSPVTQADMASHAIILAGLERLTPGWPMLSEESTAISFEERSAW